MKNKILPNTMPLNELAFEQYFQLVKARNKQRVEGFAIESPFENFHYPLKVLEKNIEHFKECHKNCMSPYKALVFLESHK